MTDRIIPSPALAATLSNYGRAFCRNAHLHHVARRRALDAAEQVLLATIEADAERALREGIEADDGPRLHIPRDLLTRPEGR